RGGRAEGSSLPGRFLRGRMASRPEARRRRARAARAGGIFLPPGNARRLCRAGSAWDAQAMRTAIAMLAVLCALGAAKADDAPKPQACAMTPLASLDAVTDAAGMMLVPATIDGHTGELLVDTGGLAATIGWGTAKQLRHSPYIPNFGGVLTGGAVLDAGV